MNSSEQLIEKISNLNRLVKPTVKLSYKNKRVQACRNFLNLNPNLPAFFWIRNNINFNLDTIWNLEKVMGYDTFNASKSFNIIYPNHLDVYMRLYFALSVFYSSGQLGSSLLNFSFILNFSFRDNENKYWYVRQNNTACEINAHNQVLNFLSWHDVLSPYNGEPITFKVYSNQGIRIYDIEESIKKQAQYYQLLPFTERQMEILRTYIVLYNADVKIKAKEVAHHLNIAKETVYTHNRDMLHRARKKYNQTFYDIYHLADFFKRYEVFS